MEEFDLIKTEIFKQFDSHSNGNCCYHRTKPLINLTDLTINDGKNNLQQIFNSEINENCKNKLSSQIYSNENLTNQKFDKSRILLQYEDAPKHLQFNPYIRSGYRTYLTTRLCLESVFWWTNETINIWSHIFGWFLFFGLTIDDIHFLNANGAMADKFIVGSILVCFQLCMIFSSIYHTFSCRSEKDYDCFLTYDLFGIALSLLAIYISGIYYAFWCHENLRNFYTITVAAIFVTAMIIQIPSLNVPPNMKISVFVAWALYGVIPTLHWTLEMGGFQNTMVKLLVPRVIGMYLISGIAFLFYITKIPERWFIGKLDFIGHSHNWWHFFVLVALYYWHNTGILYLDYRITYGCAFE